MTGFILKLIAYPLVVLAADSFLPSIYYSSFYQLLIVGLAIAVVGHLAEVLLLRRGTLWNTRTRSNVSQMNKRAGAAACSFVF